MKQAIASDKVAIYIRWSTEDQGQGHTLEIQRESCRYYCLSQGWAPREDLTFIDDGYSGGNLGRPALARLRAAAQAGLVECVVVYKLDRLSRDIKDIINLVLDEWEDRCTVRSTQEPVEVGCPLLREKDLSGESWRTVGLEMAQGPTPFDRK